jgi:splicing factor 1
MGNENEKAVIPGMPTILPADLPPSQAEAYIAQLQIEELTRKLRTGDLGIPPNPDDRSPSPEPIYGTDGKRLNTREYRTRKKLEEERHKLIQLLLKINPDYKPPADYRAPIIKIVDRVPIPQEEHPEINFVGLLIGPRGNTLKGLEKDTGAKIIIRGKGSVKEGKVGGKAGHPLPGEDEPLHAYVTSNNPESVKKACENIKEIIRQGIEMPESQNDLRKNQLRELALLNGTLREGEGPKCSNCGSTAHRTWHCPDKPNITNSVICTVCGGAGHIAKDCRMKRPGAGGPPTGNPNERAKIDEEYMSLMAELGEATPGKDGGNSGGPRPQSTGAFSNLFNKPSAPRALMAPGTMPHNPPRSDWNNSGQPPPPGDVGKSHAQPPVPGSSPPSWGYPSQYSAYPPAVGSWGGGWGGPPPPVPPPPGATQPPPPGMYWQSGGNYGLQPPPPPPDNSHRPPPPPAN